MRVELHCHSTCSDGSHPPAEVVRRAEAAGVELFCLTDHDTSAGFAEVAEAARATRVMRGVEMSCTADGRTVHVLFYDVAGDERWAELEERLVALRQARRERLHAIAERLRALGIELDVEPLLAQSVERSVGRPDIARALVAAGAVGSIGEAFDRYLRDGGPADVVVDRISVGQGLALGRRVGARMSLAHPHILGALAEQLLTRHRGSGLDGLEAYYGVYNRKERDKWLKLARRYDMVVTGGSDFHGSQLPQISRPGIELPDPHAEPLRRWLAL